MRRSSSIPLAPALDQISHLTGWQPAPVCIVQGSSSGQVSHGYFACFDGGSPASRDCAPGWSVVNPAAPAVLERPPCAACSESAWACRAAAMADAASEFASELESAGGGVPVPPSNSIRSSESRVRASQREVCGSDIATDCGAAGDRCGCLLWWGRVRSLAGLPDGSEGPGGCLRRCSFRAEQRVDTCRFLIQRFGRSFQRRAPRWPWSAAGLAPPLPGRASPPFRRQSPPVVRWTAPPPRSAAPFVSRSPSQVLRRARDIFGKRRLLLSGLLHRVARWRSGVS